MPRNPEKPVTIRRGIIEVACIIFLYYSNLLMGEFTRSARPGKTLAFALRDIFTLTNFAIALVSSILGYVVFTHWRRTTPL